MAEIRSKVFQERIRPFAAAGFGGDPESPPPQPLQETALRVGHRSGDFAERVGEEAERSLRGDAAVDLTHGTGRSVPGIGERLPPRRDDADVQIGEVRLRHVDLAPDFEHVGSIGWQHPGDVGNRHGVRRQILAGGAVSPQGGEDQDAVLVAEIEGESVDLRFRRVRDGISVGGAP